MRAGAGDGWGWWVQNVSHAIHLLVKAAELDPNDAQTWYILGRCQVPPRPMPGPPAAPPALPPPEPRFRGAWF